MTSFFSFCGSEVHSLLIPFSKESIKAKKVSNFKALFDMLRYNWRHGVVVITTAPLHSTKPELRLCVGSIPACGASEIRDGEDIWQWTRLKIRLNAFRRSTIPQKQFIIINIVIIDIIIIHAHFSRNLKALNLKVSFLDSPF